MQRAKLQKLPDKGKRIQDFYDKVLEELNRRSNVDEAAKLFSGLNIAAKGEKALNEMEWRGKLNSQANDDPLEDVLDSDDEVEMDPLRIIAQRQMHERKVRVEPAEQKLITEEDLKEIQSFPDSSKYDGFYGKFVLKIRSGYVPKVPSGDILALILIPACLHKSLKIVYLFIPSL